MKKRQKIEMVRIQESLCLELEKLPFLGYESLNRQLLVIISRKLEGPSVRSAFTRWVYKYIQQCANEEKCNLRELPQKIFEIDLPLTIEMTMAAIYLLNQLLDGKNEVNNLSAITMNAYHYSLLKDLIYDYIDNNFDQDAPEISKKVRLMFRFVDVGQTLGTECNLHWLFDHQSVMPEIDQDMNNMIFLDSVEPVMKNLLKTISQYNLAIEYYFKRNYLISSSLFRIVAEIVIQLSGYNGREKDNIFQFADNYGVMMQIVNDTTDFVLERGTRNKQLKDVLNDLKNGLVTLPLLFHFEKNRPPGLIETFLETRDKRILEGKHNEIMKEMILSGALMGSLKVGQQIARQSKVLIRKNSKYAEHLLTLLEISENNRYYHHIYGAKKFYKKKENANVLYRCEDHLSR